ncbi:MAG: hypothetical protein AAF650_00790 [Pseudomonadota bacterium]
MTQPAFRLIALGLGAAALAILMALQALSSAATRSNPQVAVTLNGFNGMAREQLAARVFLDASAQAQDIPKAAASARDLALTAYRSEPLVPKALMIAALSTPEAQDKDRILRLASRLNRRDLSLQAAVLEQKISVGDYTGVIATLDQILRVHPDYRAEFFPVLEEALVAPGTLEAFEDMLDGSSPWHERFLFHALRNPAARAQLAQLRPSITVTRVEFDRRLISGLAAQGEFELAQSVYNLATGQEDTMGGPVEETLAWSGQYPPFEWQLIDARDIRAQESRDGEDLELFVRAGQGAVVAQRFITVPAPELSLATTLEPTQANLAGRVTLSVFCGAARQPLAQLDLARGENALPLPALDADCEALRIELSARVLRGDPTLRARLARLRLVASADTAPAPREGAPPSSPS